MNYTRHSKKVGFHIKVAGSMERNNIPVTAKSITDEYKRQNHDLLRKGLRVLKWKMVMGYHNDDFIRDMFTVSLTGQVFRIPRIIKNNLIRKRYGKVLRSFYR